MRNRGRALRRVAVLCAILALATAVAFHVEHRPDAGAERPIVGVVRQTEIRIAPEVSGRLSEVLVQAGQAVHRGDVLARLDNPELTAALGEAIANVAVAKAARDHLYAGPRREDVAALAQAVDIAQANLTYARQQRARSAALAPADYVSGQQVDTDVAGLVVAQANLAARQAALAEAKAGATAEERAEADAKVAAAEASVVTLQAQLAKTVLTAPADGTIGTLVAEPGEAIVPGKAVLVLNPKDGIWFSFTVREDRMQAFALGETLDLDPGDGNKVIARVTATRPLGEFAVWRATRAVGDHDLNTFAIRADPVSAAKLPEPGAAVFPR
jgi:HlyD family secretion protein